MNQISGLPAHILLIHLVVIGVPAAALLTVLSAVWPTARLRLGVITPVIAFLALVTVPITTRAGEWLQRHVYIDPKADQGKAILRHVAIGKDLTPWAAGLFVLALAAWGIPVLIGRARGPALLASVGVKIAVGVLAVGAALFSVIQVYRIGDAGARAAWSSNFCSVEIAVGQSCPVGG